MSYNNKKVILVDDNNMMLKIATKVLEKYNFNKIDTKTNAFDCMQAINQNEYDLIIADDMMPEMSGTEMMFKLKEAENFKIPIVVLTGNVEIPNAKEHYLNLGFDDFLAKPINLEELDRVIKKFIL
ncbi:MAG: response regulator [Bacilli bacterium]|nr:response regulator [Bacilli bacterium]